MKKNLLILILMLSINNLIAEQLFICFTLTQEESQILTYLQNSYIQDKLFYKRFSRADLACSLDILSKKIQLLNKQALPENSKKLKSFLIALGFIPLSVAICLVTPIGKEIHTLYTQFKARKFKDIHLPLSIVEKLPSKTISKQEKRYLKKFSFEELYFDYVEDRSEPWWKKQKETIQNTYANLSPAEKEKIHYLALRSAITNCKWRSLALTCLVIIVLTVGAMCSIIVFDEAFNNSAKIQTEIKFNKEIYNLLKKEQERYQFFNLH